VLFVVAYNLTRPQQAGSHPELQHADQAVSAVQVVPDAYVQMGEHSSGKRPDARAGGVREAASFRLPKLYPSQLQAGLVRYTTPAITRARSIAQEVVSYAEAGDQRDKIPAAQ